MSESGKYPLIPLSEVLVQDKEYVTELEPRLYPKLSVKLYGKGVVLTDPADGATVRMKRHQLAKSGQVILSEIWAKKGAIGIVPEEGAGALVTSHFFLFEIDESKLLRPYMRWLLVANYFEPVLGEQARGTTGYAAIRPKQFLACKIPLPPLDEQRRIVARIEELAALIEEARGLRVKTREEAKALVAAAVVELFTTCRGSDWIGYHLGDLVTESRYGTSEKAHVEPIGTPILRMGNIQNGKLDLTDLKYFHLADRHREKLLLQPDDVLVNRTNSAELVGKCAVFEEKDEYTFASYLIRLRLDLTKAVPQLIAAYMNSPIGRAYMFSERKQMTGQANVNSKTLRAMPISLPPVDEQHRIVAYLDGLQAQVDELTALQDATQAELDALLPSVLDRAFQGEL